MSSAYIAGLNRLLQAGVTPPAPSLSKRFIDWYAALPEIARQRPFAMAELEQALGSQGRYIGEVLLELGWRRRRKWSRGGQYNRYWLPPTG